MKLVPKPNLPGSQRLTRRKMLATTVSLASSLPPIPTINRTVYAAGSGIADNSPSDASSQAEQLCRILKESADEGFDAVVSRPSRTLDRLSRLRIYRSDPNSWTTLRHALRDDALAAIRSARPLEQLSCIRSYNGALTVRGTAYLNPDQTFVVPRDVRVLDLQEAAFCKLGGGAPLVTVSHTCSIIGGLFINLDREKGYGSGATISLENADGSRITNATFLTTGNTSIYARDCSRLEITQNVLLGLSSDRPKSHAMLQHDILLWGQCQENFIADNKIATGNGIGIFIQAGEGTRGAVNYNVIVGNAVYGAREYGISVYTKNNVPITQAEWTLIGGNYIATVHGDVDNSNATGRIYGSGIYIQGFHKSIIVYNYVKDVCLHSTSYLLGPAAISIANSSSAMIMRNGLVRSNWYGVYIKDTGRIDPAGKSILFENDLSGCAKGGARIVSAGDVESIGNTFRLRKGVPDLQVMAP